MKTLTIVIDLFVDYSKGTMHSSNHDYLKTLKWFKVRCHPFITLVIIEVHWKPPLDFQYKLNFDEATKGHPTLATNGAFFYDYIIGFKWGG